MRYTEAEWLADMAEGWKDPGSKNGRVKRIPIPTQPTWYWSVGTFGARVGVRESRPGSVLLLITYSRETRGNFATSLGHKDREMAKRQATDLAIQYEEARTQQRAARIAAKLAILTRRRVRPLRTHFACGHEVTPENVSIHGSRQKIRCRTCLNRGDEKRKKRQGRPKRKNYLGRSAV